MLIREMAGGWCHNSRSATVSVWLWELRGLQAIWGPHVTQVCGTVGRGIQLGRGPQNSFEVSGGGDGGHIPQQVRSGVDKTDMLWKKVPDKNMSQGQPTVLLGMCGVSGVFGGCVPGNHTWPPLLDLLNFNQVGAGSNCMHLCAQGWNTCLG